MWTATTRAQHRRDGLRFASDLTDAEWVVIEPLLPPPAKVGRPSEWPMREIVNAIFYVLRGGVSWRMLPPCFPPRQTVYGSSRRGRTTGSGRRSRTISVSVRPRPQLWRDECQAGLCLWVVPMFQGSSSSTQFTGWSAMQPMTWRK